MANLEFNLFDELENSDPRVEHFWQSRLSAFCKLDLSSDASSRRSHGEPDGSERVHGERVGSRRIHIGRIPISVLDSALKATLCQFGIFADYRRRKDSRPGFIGFTYAHVSFESPEVAAKAIFGLRQLDFGGCNLIVKTAQERSERVSTMPTVSNEKNMLPLRLNEPVKVVFQPVEIYPNKQLFFLNDGRCSAFCPSLNKSFEGKLTNLENYLTSNVNQIKSIPHPHSVSVGEDVLAEYDGRFYRALVLKQLTTSQFCVWFTDYCNVDTKRIDYIRKMEDSIRDMCPRVGHILQLAQIQPTLDKGYFDEALEWMSKFIAEPNETTIEVVERRNIPNGVVNMVKIFVTNKETGSTTNLADEMIKKRYAFPKNPAPLRDPFPVKYSQLRFRKASDFQNRPPFSAEIVHFDSPTDFWVIEQSESKQLQEHQIVVQRTADEMDPPNERPEIGDMVLALWNDGSTQAFYRAVVLKHCDDGRTCVQFVDYGNRDDVSLLDVRALCEELAQFPMQALKCSFVGLASPSPMWSQRAKERTRDILTRCDAIWCEVRNQEPPDNLSHRKFQVVLRGSDKKALNDKVREAIESEATPLSQAPPSSYPQAPPSSYPQAPPPSYPQAPLSRPQVPPSSYSQASPSSQTSHSSHSQAQVSVVAESSLGHFSSAGFRPISTNGFSSVEDASDASRLGPLPANGRSNPSHVLKPTAYPTVSSHSQPLPRSHQTAPRSQTGPNRDHALNQNHGPSQNHGPPIVNGNSESFDPESFGRPVPNHRVNNSPSCASSRYASSSHSGDRSLPNGIRALPNVEVVDRSRPNGDRSRPNGNESIADGPPKLLDSYSSSASQESLLTKSKTISPVDISSTSSSLTSDDIAAETLLSVSSNEKLLQDRVDALERLVEEQRLQIVKLTQCLEAKDSIGSQSEERLENMEAEMKLLKRNHEILELHLVKKKIL